jgi:HAMP domain-containing protein
MGLRLKFNLMLLFVFALGLAVTGYISYDLLHRNAREDVLRNAGVMMEAALSMRGYTNTQIRPLIPYSEDVFHPQSVPAYSATEIMNALRKKYADYSYKEATLNPTNPRNRAVDWETDVVNQFRNNAEHTEIVGERDTPTGRLLYIARPIQIRDAACLTCHSTVDAAPKTLIERYGPANGFGWRLNEIVGAQVVSVPTDVPIQRARAAFRNFMLALAGVFVFVAIVLNLMLVSMVIRPVSRLAKLADQVSMGKMDVPDFNVRSKDEIRMLADSFNRMKKSVVQAMKMLDE